jgi:replicative DNA helicase
MNNGTKEQPEAKIPPSSEEAEQALLGCIITGGEREQEIGLAWIRDENAFYSEDNKLIWKAFTELYKDNITIDFVTINDKVKEINGKSMAYYITGLAEAIPTRANVQQYAKIVWEKYIQRETAKSAYELYNASHENYKEVDSILENHTKLVSELREIQPSKERKIEDLVDEMIEVVEEDTNLIPFNLAHLDMFAGGMTRKEITVLGGRPGHGKTTLVINMIRGLLKQGFTVMLFNREMSNTEMLKKMVVMESKSLEYANIRRNDLSETDKKEFESTSNVIKKEYGNLLMYDGVRNLEDSLREIAKHKPDVVIDDYIQLINVSNVREGRRFEIEKIMQEYKWICKTENCSAILVSQLNREIEKRLDPRPRMSDYAESGVIEQTAESAMFVFYGHNFDSERYSPYKSEIIVSKSRYGKIGTHKVGFNGGRCKFYMNSDMAQGDSHKNGA